ncbi:MAG: hypothetical protein LBU66_02280 [Treponema sp.]|jgi:opacity protein-like surface antigen|nr:hypothetical protein [Treponema sp.]
MKKILLPALIILLSAPAFAQISVPYFGGNSFSMDADTIFSSDMNNGASGLQTIVGFGLWFEFLPYADRNITPQRDAVSVSLRLSNSSAYAWRGYDSPDDSGHLTPTLYGQPDQATSIWFDTIIAQLEYNQYWFRIAGIEPEITLSQASIKSVFDPVIRNRGDVAKNQLPLPLFHAGALYNGAGGVVSVIGQDLVHLNRREVEISGNLSAGMKTEIIDIALKAGSWKTAEENIENSWVAGADFSIRPDFSNLINFSMMTAANYDTVERRHGVENQEAINDAMSNPDALKENPIALGLGYEYRINLPNNHVLRPYIGVDYIYETTIKDYNYEIGGGLQWFFRGTGATYKRNTRIGGISLGDVDLPVALIVGFNIDRNGIVNGIVSLNESPHSSFIPRLGGFFNLELLNITQKEYHSYMGASEWGQEPAKHTYNDFLWAVMGQVEYMLDEKIMPYIYARYIPGTHDFVPGYKIDPDPAPEFAKNNITITTKAGFQLMFIKHFTIDLWYERNDVRKDYWESDNLQVKFKREWTADNGLLCVNFRISL